MKRNENQRNNQYTSSAQPIQNWYKIDAKTQPSRLLSSGNAEHMYIWSAISLDIISKKHGLFLYDLENNTVHGGCTRYYFCHRGHFKRTKRCNNFITKEKKLGLNKAVTYKKFREKILNHSNKLYKLVYDL